MVGWRGAGESMGEEKKKKNKAGSVPLVFAKCSSGQNITRKQSDRLKKGTGRHQ